MIPSSKRTLVMAVAFFLFLPIIGLQTVIDSFRDKNRDKYEPGLHNTGNAIKQLPIEFALGALTGFREAVAGLLWVRTDEFFHNGDYESITPMIRIITWLDPHQLDVYETGAWHMDYNFTDTDQRSDRRYIPLSVALLKEGIVNNPNVPELFSDLAFTHFYRKIGDYPEAARTFQGGQDLAETMKHDGINAPQDSELQGQAADAAKTVTTVGHGLAHALEAEGKITEAEKQWQYCIVQHTANIAKSGKNDYGENSGLQNSKKQLYEMQQRAKWRARDVQKQVDFKFHPVLVRVAPKVFVLKGTMNVVGAKTFNLETGVADWQPTDGTRVEIRLEDAGYHMPKITGFSLTDLNLDPNVTIMQEAASVRNGKIGGDSGRKIDMSKDPQMYSFTAPKYTVTLWFNPANPNDCPPQVQDRIGWLGEGMTNSDLKAIDTSGEIPGDVSGKIPGLRLLKRTITLTREDILGQGEKEF